MNEDRLQSHDRNKNIILPIRYFGFTITIHAAFTMSSTLSEFTYILHSSLVTEGSEAMEFTILKLPLIENGIFQIFTT